MHIQILAHNCRNGQSLPQAEETETHIENTRKIALLANIRSVDAIGDSNKDARILTGLAYGNRIPWLKFLESWQEAQGGISHE